MKMNPYIGHASQLCSVEEVRLIGGKGDGMRLLQLRNAKGLEMTICPDRCADIYRLIFKGDNMGYFSPSGYVAPAYYDQFGAGFLKSFTAGFLTTCGLAAVGSPCTDEGEDLPLHGTIGNTPCERIWWDEDEDNIYIHAIINDSGIFSRKFMLKRTITCGKNVNTFRITDTISNQGDTVSPLMLLYHMNNGTLRWFAIFGLLVGMLFYKKIFGDFLVIFMSTILGRILHLVVGVAAPPLKLVKSAFFKGFRSFLSI